MQNGSKVRKIIGVVAGKGGVGKSAVAVNTALAMSFRGFKIGILDADIYGPSVAKMIPVLTYPRANGDSQEEIFPAEGGGVKIISTSFFASSGAMVVRAPIANGIILQFLKNVIWGDLDYLFIDFPPGTGDIQLTLMQEGVLSGAVVVTTPQEIALLDVRKAIHMLEEMNVPILGIVENMSYLLHGDQKIFPFGSGGGEKLANERGIPFLGKVPMDPRMSFCMDNGVSIFSEDGLLKEIFLDVSHKIEEILGQTENSRGLQSFELVWKEWKNDFSL